MNPSGDPRVYFAAERTLLAWLRTGIGVMAFGFVVARFGLFLRLLQAQGAPPAGHPLSPLVGTCLVLLGAAAVAAGAVHYHQFVRRLPPQEIPASWGPGTALALAWSVVLVGIVLAAVLVT